MNEIVFTTFLIWLVILILLSFFVDYLLARIFSKGAHRFFVFLGVIVHEYSHAFGCVITRTKISEIKLFEETGGHVTHQKRNPIITSIIGMMPLFGCSIFFLILAFIFGQIGVRFYTTGLSLSPQNFFDGLWQFIEAAGKTFYYNIILLNIITVFFFIFLYLVGSVAACIAPSTVDLKNSFIGVVLLIILGYATIYLHPLGYSSWVTDTFHTPTPILDFVVKYLSYAIGLGLLGVILILVILVPVALLKKR
jgi:hypothetical protein